MPVKFESVRFGAVEVPDEQVLEFPFGLIGLGGLRYAIVDNNPGTGFFWLHSVEDAALGLPIVDPHQFFSDFALEMYDEDRERTGLGELSEAKMFVTVRARPNPSEVTVNLRAPLVILDGKGYQVLNKSKNAPLQAPLFEIAAQSQAAAVPEPARAADAA
jgi:flagellar assembly factor FliW